MLRSMVWPSVAVIGTLTVTIAVLAAFRAPRTVGVPENAPEIHAWFTEAEFEVLTFPDPRQAVVDQYVPVAVSADGRRMWAAGSSTTGYEVEEVLRDKLAAPWLLRTSRQLPGIDQGQRQGRNISRMVGILFVMYGTVFGLGSVARDRDDGSLEAELSLPVPRWIGGLARWLASSLVLAVFYALCVLLLAACIGVEDWASTVRHGIAACAAGVAVGLAVVGTAGIKQGFSGPLSASLTVVTGLAALGALGIDWLPISSLLSSGAGWVPLLVAGLFGLASAAIYSVRTGRS